MALSEFDLIDRFFLRASGRKDVVLGVGDDAALVSVPPGSELVVAADAIVSGVHFPADFDAGHVGYRALAVNLSDIAAMGAEPAWFTLCLTLPAVDETWLAGFSESLLALAARHHMALIGGDTTSGPMTVAVQILGCVPAGTALRRSGAQPGDVVCLSGSVGDAAGGLRLLQDGGADEGGEDTAYLLDRFARPTPRVALGKILRGVATAAIDISDGLCADVAKLGAASGVAIRLEVDALPLSAALLRRFGPDVAREYALRGGDDYELCFTVPPADLEGLRSKAQSQGHFIHRIGVAERGQGVRGYASGRAVDLDCRGYDHFRS